MTGALPPGPARPSAVPLVAAGFVISFVLVGGGIDTVSVFLNALGHATGWSRSMLSLAVSIGAASAALSTPLVGAAIDRYGVRVPMTVGVVLLAIGFGVLFVMREAWQFAAANVFLGTGFAAAALLPFPVAVTMCVPTNTSLALGIVSAGASAGALVLAPAAQAVIDAAGWRSAYLAMGTAVIVTPLPFLAFALPRGRLRRAVQASDPPPSQLTLVREMRRPGVARLAGTIVLPGLVGFSVSVHLVPYLTGLGHATTTAAAALGAMIGISAVGKISGGFVADRIGALATLRLALVAWTVALAALHHASSMAALGAFVALYGLAFGTQIAVIPAIAIRVFGPTRFGTLFGVLQLGGILASAVGPVMSGVMYDRTGSYGSALIMWVGMMAAATAIAFAMRTSRNEPAVA